MAQYFCFSGLWMKPINNGELKLPETIKNQKQLKSKNEKIIDINNIIDPKQKVELEDGRSAYDISSLYSNGSFEYDLNNRANVRAEFTRPLDMKKNLFDDNSILIENDAFKPLKISNSTKKSNHMKDNSIISSNLTTNLSETVSENKIKSSKFKEKDKKLPIPNSKFSKNLGVISEETKKSFNEEIYSDASITSSVNKYDSKLDLSKRNKNEYLKSTRFNSSYNQEKETLIKHNNTRLVKYKDKNEIKQKKRKNSSNSNDSRRSHKSNHRQYQKYDKHRDIINFNRRKEEEHRNLLIYNDKPPREYNNPQYIVPNQQSNYNPYLQNQNPYFPIYQVPYNPYYNYNQHYQPYGYPQNPMNYQQHNMISNTPFNNYQESISSCVKCEEIYKYLLFNSLPMKIFTCLYCNNTLNVTSLEIYSNKYSKELEDYYKNALSETLTPLENLNLNKIKKDLTETKQELKKTHYNYEPESNEFLFPKKIVDMDLSLKDEPVQISFNDNKNDPWVAWIPAENEENERILSDEGENNKDNQAIVSEHFKKKKKELFEKIEKREHSKEKVVKSEKTDEINIEEKKIHKKQLSKPKKGKDIDLIKSIEENKQFEESHKESLNRLMNGEKINLSAKEIKEINNKLYNTSSEGQKKAKERQTKENQEKRNETLKNFNKKIREEIKEISSVK